MTEIEYISGPQSVAMDDEWFQFARPEHFWIQWRFDALHRVRSLLPSEGARVLEVGCGNGLVLCHLEDRLGYTADGCDLNIEGLKLVPQMRRGRVLLYDIFERRSEMLGAYDAVFLMDVLEHIDEQASFLSACLDHLRPNAVVVINVPAFQFLFSNYDSIVGHQRRYDTASMRMLLESVNLEFLHSAYWGAPLLPLLMLRKALLAFTKEENRVRIGFEPPGNLAHSVLHGLRKIEGGLSITPPFGTSLLAVARKRGAVVKAE